MTSSGFRALVLAVLLLPSCAEDDGDVSGPEASVVRLNLLSVPADVRCVRVRVAYAGQTVQRTFDVQPGTSPTLELTSLPTGRANISEDATAVGCGSITGTTQITWLTEPVTVDLTPGVLVTLPLTFRRPPRITIINDWIDGNHSPDAGRDASADTRSDANTTDGPRSDASRDADAGGDVARGADARVADSGRGH